jgi:hypothetical protein
MPVLRGYLWAHKGECSANEVRASTRLRGPAARLGARCLAA